MNGLIQAYRNALSVLETQNNPNVDHLIAAKCNLGIAHFYNSEIQEAVNYIEEALGHFERDLAKSKRSVFRNDHRSSKIEN